MKKHSLEIKKSVKCNEWLLVNLESPFSDLDRLTKISAQGSGAKNLIIQYRYSDDGLNYSEWVTWGTWNIKNKFNTLWFSFRVKSDTDWVFDNLVLEWISGELLDDICEFTTRIYNENSFITKCNNLQNEYNVAFGAVKIWEEMSLSIFQRFGWSVIYFKVNGLKQSKDVVFNEYSLHKVSECKKIPLVVPNNDFGSGDFQFTEFDIDFADDLEIQISKEQFWSAFGYLEQPSEKDFVYFPLEGRMFRVNSIQESKDFMRKSFWWKGTLIKWNDSDSINKSDNIQEVIDEITLNYSNTNFEEQMENEGEDLTVPQQYTSRVINQNDNVRESVNTEWESTGVISENLSNFYTIFSKYQYDLNFEENIELIKYQNTIDTSSSFSIMFWYKAEKRKEEQDDTYLKLFSGNNDIEIKITDNFITGIKIFDKEYILNLKICEWFAYYIGINKVDNNLVLRVYQRSDLNKKTTKMTIIEEQKCTLGNINNNWKPSLWSSGDKITSIRFLKGLVNLEDQSTLFTQLIFKDSSKAFIIDECYKIINLEKFSGR